MNKSILWVKLFFLVIILMMFLVFAINPIINVGNSNTNFGLNIGGMFGVNEVKRNPNHKVIDSSTSVEIDVDLMEEVEVDLIAGSLDITYHDKETIIIEYQKPENGDDMLYVVDGDTLKIAADRNQMWFGFGNQKDGEVSIKIPENLKLDYNLDLVSGLADVSVDAVEIKIEAVNGNVIFRGSAKELRVETVNGNADLSGDIDEINADTVSGNIKLTGEIKELDLDSVSGDVSFKVTNVTNEVDVDTISGDIYMNDVSDGIVIKFDSVSGDIEDKVNDKSFKSEYYEIGTGQREINIDTVSGDLVITN